MKIEQGLVRNIAISAVAQAINKDTSIGTAFDNIFEDIYDNMSAIKFTYPDKQDIQFQTKQKVYAYIRKMLESA